jgi:hypothetical protein
MQPDELLRHLPGYPVTAWILALLVMIGALLNILGNRPQRQKNTNANFGKRLQDAEQAIQLERTRRQQVEHELRRRGIALPHWPGDPLEQPSRDATPAGPEVPETSVNRVPVPPLPPAERALAARHRR